MGAGFHLAAIACHGAAQPCDYTPEIRKAIYATNAIESVNMSLCKLTKICAVPTDEALMKLLYLALPHLSTKHGRCRSEMARPHSTALRSSVSADCLSSEPHSCSHRILHTLRSP